MADKYQIKSDYPDSRRFKKNLFLYLFLTALLPLAAIGFVFYFYSPSIWPGSMLIIIGLCFLLLLGGIFLLTDRFLLGLEKNRRSFHFLERQLRVTSHLASSMELSYSFFREAKDTLANIDVTARWMEDLAEKEKDNEVLKSIRQIIAEARRGRDSIDKFLHFVRSSESIITELDIHEILEDLLYFLKGDLDFRNIIIRKEFQASLPKIRSDRNKIRQVFQYLILNAMSAVDEDPEIGIMTHGDQHGIMVTFSDNGPGFSIEDMEKIFDPFFTTKPGKAGLGLTMCREILEDLGGSITMESFSGRGASFSVEFPLFFKPYPGNKSNI